MTWGLITKTVQAQSEVRISDPDGQYKVVRRIFGSQYQVQVTITGQMDDFNIDLLPLGIAKQHKCLGFLAGKLANAALIPTGIPNIQVDNVLTNGVQQGIPVMQDQNLDRYYLFTEDTNMGMIYMTDSGLCDLENDKAEFSYTKPISQNQPDIVVYYTFWGILIH